MKALLLHGPQDLRLEELPYPGSPANDEVLLEIRSVGICASDLQIFGSGSIATTAFLTPLVLGHEFMGVVAEAGLDARDGLNRPLRTGQRVSIDPHIPCNRCEACLSGKPNLCLDHAFMGVYPTDGGLREYLICPSANCYPVPDAMTDSAATLLETLGVCLHATDLAKIKFGYDVGIIGCGPVGLLLLRLAKLSGAHRVFVTDPITRRMRFAEAWGGIPLDPKASRNRLDVVFEAAWADDAAVLATEMAKPGARVVLVGIPNGDDLNLQHSTVRRKGLTLMLSRRMRHTYDRTLKMVSRFPDQIDLDALVSHHFPFEEASDAFQLNAAYEDDVLKVMLEPQSEFAL